MLPLFWLLVSQQTGLHCATMFSSVAMKGSLSVDTVAKPGRIWREVAFEWPEITWPWVENTNICYSVRGSLDFLEMRELDDLDLISGEWHIFHRACVNSVNFFLRALLWGSVFCMHFTCCFVKLKLWQNINVQETWSFWAFGHKGSVHRWWMCLLWLLKSNWYWHFVWHNSAPAFSMKYSNFPQLNQHSSSYV